MIDFTIYEWCGWLITICMAFLLGYSYRSYLGIIEQEKLRKEMLQSLSKGQKNKEVATK